jgi:hypothetical protein
LGLVDTISTNYLTWATALFSTHITLLSIFKQLLRGKAKVEIETGLLALAHNLKKMAA